MTDTQKTWEEEQAEYPHPQAMTFPDDYELPDGVCIAGGWIYDWQTEGKMKGAVVQLLSQRAFELFPDAPRPVLLKGCCGSQESN